VAFVDHIGDGPDGRLDRLDRRDRTPIDRTLDDRKPVY
jgi:hypothetical protein